MLWIGRGCLGKAHPAPKLLYTTAMFARDFRDLETTMHTSVLIEQRSGALDRPDACHRLSTMTRAVLIRTASRYTENTYAVVGARALVGFDSYDSEF